MLTLRGILNQHSILKFACAGAVALSGLFSLSPVYAEDCDDLDNNKTWVANFQALNAAYDNGDYGLALEYSRELEAICEQSPILNYMIAYIYKSKGDDEKYLFYLQKSTQNTELFAVDKDTLDRIWSDKYIAAHPEADPVHIKKREAAIASQAEDIAQLKEQLKSAERMAGASIALNDELNAAHASDDVMLWTSVAIGGAGIVLTAVGAVLVAQYQDNAVGIKGGSDAYVKSNYPMAWSLVGAGIGVTAIGAALTGYFGYRYSLNHKDDNANELSVSISPAYSSVSFTF